MLGYLVAGLLFLFFASVEFLVVWVELGKRLKNPIVFALVFALVYPAVVLLTLVLGSPIGDPIYGNPGWW